ncbi:MAG: redoxin family protein [Culturomica sp.]|jgi:thiol-disulfide isomerase/thioredoxin|nr:redoxin family protein [Culturomica sp.]
MIRKNLLSVFTALLLLSCASVPGVKFGDNLEKALEKAKKAEKPVFVVLLDQENKNSQKMHQEVFPDTATGEYYNAHFVPVLLWENSPQAEELFSRYGFTYYPAFLFLSPEGDFLKKEAGFRDPEALLRMGQEYKVPEADTLAALRRAFDAGAISREQLKAYLELSSSFGIQNRKALEQWIESDREGAVSAETFTLINSQRCDVQSMPFRFVLDHAAGFAAVVGENEVELYIYGKYLEHLRALPEGERETFIAGLREGGYPQAGALTEHLALPPFQSKSPADKELLERIDRLTDTYPVIAPFLGKEMMRQVNKKNPGFDEHMVEFTGKIAAYAPAQAAQIARYIANNYLTPYGDILAADPWVNRYLLWSGNPDYDPRITKFVKQATGEYPSDDYGKEMPDYSLKDLNGKEVSISSLRGKFLLMDFWASWCGPCKADIPHVKAAYEKFKNAPIRFVSITNDRNDDDWKKAVAEINVPWLHVTSKGTDMLRKYGVHGIPRIMVLDPQGRLVADHLSGATIEVQLNRLAKKYGWKL